jgi:hypothetical protein
MIGNDHLSSDDDLLLIENDRFLTDSDHFILIMIILVVRNDRSMTENDCVIV